MSNKTWRCFHCDEVFGDKRDARLHFGETQEQTPVCQIDAREYRAMEFLVQKYREEDTDLHREIARMQADVAVALRRAEENGYARGLEDGASKERALLLCRAAGWLAAPEGESAKATRQLIERLVAALKVHASETEASEFERLKETVQRYAEHHEHCEITAFHGVREKSELSRLRGLLEAIAAREPEARRAVAAGEHNTTFAIDLASMARLGLEGTLYGHAPKAECAHEWRDAPCPENLNRMRCRLCGVTS